MAREVVEWNLQITGDTAARARELAGAFGVGLAGGAAAAATAVTTVTAALTAGATAIASFTRQNADAIDNIHTLAASTGLAADTISGMRTAAAAVNKELSAFLPQDIARRMIQAQLGLSRAKRGFDLLGIAVEDSNGKMRNVDTVFREIIDRLQSIDDDGLRAAAATELLGKQGGELLTAFSDSSALDDWVEMTRQYGIDHGPEAVEITNAWFDATARLQTAFEGAKSKLFELVGPTAIGAVQTAAEALVFYTEILSGATALQASQRAQSLFDPDTSNANVVVPGTAPPGTTDEEIRKNLSNMRPGRGAAGGSSGFQVPQTGFFRAVSELSAQMAAEAEAEQERHLETLQLWSSDIGGQLDQVNRNLDAQIAQAQQQNAQTVAGALTGQMSLGGVVGAIAPGPLGAIAGPIVDALSQEGGETVVRDAIVDLQGQLINVIDNVPAAIGELLNPEFLVKVLIKGTKAIVEGLVQVPVMIVEGLLEFLVNLPAMIAKAITSIPGFLKDSEGRFLGTSFKRDNLSFFGTELGEAQSRFAGNPLAFAGAGLPQFERGTPRVPRTGPAIVHEGEAIIPANQAAAMRRGGGSGVTIYMQAPGNARRVAESLNRQLGGFGLNLDLNPLEV